MGIEAVCTEIYRRDPRTTSTSSPLSSSSQHTHGPSQPIRLSTVFRDLFPPQIDASLPRRFDSLSSKSRPGQYPSSPTEQSTSFANDDLPFYYTVTISKTSSSSSSYPTVTTTSPKGQLTPRYALLSPTWTSKVTTLLTPEAVAIILSPLSMKDLFEMLTLIVTKGPSESFSPSYSSDFSSFLQPHGKSYQDLVNLLPSWNRDLLTKIIVATRHWARCEAVEVVGKRRRHSIDSCSRDDLSLSGFGELLSPELPPMEDSNRVFLQRLANALFCSSDLPKDYSSLYYGRDQDSYMADYRFPRSSRDSLQSSPEDAVDDKDALEALENLLLLHESVDQLESWRCFLDSHAALSLPPWRTNVKTQRGPAVAPQETKTLLRRKTSRNRSTAETSPTKGQSDKNLPTLYENASSAPGGGLYNYKTSYFQFRHRQYRARHDSTLEHYSMSKKEPLVTDASQPTPIHPLDLASGTLGLVEITTSLPTNTTDSVVLSTHSQPITPASVVQVEQTEFIAPPMKDLYSAPIVMVPNRPSERTNSSGPIDATSSHTRSITAAADASGIRTAKKRPCPIILASSGPHSRFMTSKSTTTTSISPTTAESLSTKIFSAQSAGDQEDADYQTAKKGWRIWERPLMHLKRKSFPSIPALPSLPINPVPPVPTSDRPDLAIGILRTSSPIVVPVAVTSKHSPVEGASDAIPKLTKPFKRPWPKPKQPQFIAFTETRHPLQRFDRNPIPVFSVLILKPR
ncbi:hypothetical protein BGZ95_008486 [Linnemannia exigua]|uniref:Uncharacterized protein n=1 Tax=Linnemannia exigua TaxID=604196 RepID=A0AAD4H8G8_9FUNG|nr:hypothetical protein BGZ95_008486 [Linnemannia exigua]